MPQLLNLIAYAQQYPNYAATKIKSKPRPVNQFPASNFNTNYSIDKQLMPIHLAIAVLKSAGLVHNILINSDVYPNPMCTALLYSGSILSGYLCIVVYLCSTNLRDGLCAAVMRYLHWYSVYLEFILDDCTYAPIWWVLGWYYQQYRCNKNNLMFYLSGCLLLISIYSRSLTMVAYKESQKYKLNKWYWSKWSKFLGSKVLRF